MFTKESDFDFLCVSGRRRGRRGERWGREKKHIVCDQRCVFHTNTGQTNTRIKRKAGFKWRWCIRVEVTGGAAVFLSVYLCLTSKGEVNSRVWPLLSAYSCFLIISVLFGLNVFSVWWPEAKLIKEKERVKSQGKEWQTEWVIAHVVSLSLSLLSLNQELNVDSVPSFSCFHFIPWRETEFLTRVSLPGWWLGWTHNRDR